MNNKTKIGIIMGGQSGEHQVSLLSAKNIIEAIDKNKYELTLVGIDRSGHWHRLDTTDYLRDAEDPKKIELSINLSTENGNPDENSILLPGDLLLEMSKLDVIFPVLHGPNGEDGTVQGLFQLLNVPFVGCGVLSSAICMDKDIAKRLLRDAGLPTVKFLAINKHDNVSYAAVSARLGKTLFVKPANLGSSVGISKVTDEQSYAAALELAFQYDRKVMIEEGVAAREIECSVLGNDNPIASLPGELIVHADFYSYEAKYIDAAGATPVIPAKLSPELTARIQELAIASFQTLDCAGLARVDFFLRGDEVIVNELNTMPGFTSISMYPKMWEESGVSYEQLTDRLIQLALDR